MLPMIIKKQDQFSRGHRHGQKVVALILLGLSTNAFSAKWKSQKDVDPVTDKAQYTTWVSSTSGHGIGKRKADLVFRCSDNELVAYVETPFYTGFQQVDVTTRFDKKPAKNEWWTPAKGGRGIFSPEPHKLLRGVTRNQQLIVRASPPASHDETIIFEMVGSKAALVAIQKACPPSASDYANLLDLQRYLSDSLHGPMRLRSPEGTADGKLTFTARLGSTGSMFVDFEEVSSDLPPDFNEWLIRELKTVSKHISLDEDLYARSVKVEIETYKVATPQNSFSKVQMNWAARTR